MAQSVTYDGNSLTLVRRDDEHAPEWVERADHGEIGESSMLVDDEAGTLEMFGHKLVTVEDDACSVVRTLTGYVGARKYRRGSGKTEASRFIEVPLYDLNARLGFKAIYGHQWQRPAETISDRLTALLASSHLSGLVADLGFVDYPTDALDAYDCRGQFPLDVIRDMALVVGYNYFVYWSSDDAAAGLWFRDSNASTAFSSTLRFSNVLSDVDESTTFPTGADAALTRDPSEVISRVLVPYKNGFRVRHRAATETTYEPRGGVAPAASIKTKAKADALGDRYLFARRNEEDTITDTWTLPDDKINLVRAGQRVQARYSHLATEGYGEFSWFRITETRKKPLVTDAGRYTCAVSLSPQEGGCSVQPTFVQHTYADSNPVAAYSDTLTFTQATVPGNLVVVAIFNTAAGAGDVLAAPSGWNWEIQNVDTNNAGNAKRCNVFWKKSEGEADFTFTCTGALIGNAGRYVMTEYAGLTNPSLYGSATNRQDPGPGSATGPSISYPDGPAAVVGICFMDDGPQGGDSLSVSSGTLRTAISGGLHGVGEVAIADNLLNTTAGSTSRTWLNTSTMPTLAVELVFTGDNC